jgi:lactate dehydrogenase-like 2-hydroxyacid dehydrogenase
MNAPNPKLLVTQRFPEAVEARARRDYEARVNETGASWGADALVEASAGMDGLLVAANDSLRADVIERLAASVRIVATFSVGYEHIDVAAAHRRGLVVTNTPDVLTDATADMAVLLMLAAARRAGEGERTLRAGAWTGWTPTQFLGTQVSGKRLGIVGMGRIGAAVAHRARAFAMEIHYHNRNRLAAGIEDGAIFHGDLDDLLPNCDFISLHCPLTPATAKLLNAERIARLPDGAVVVNTARGAVVDDAALIAALKSGKVAAAGLDVYDGEPNVNAGYMGLDNAFLAPHLGSATLETRNAMGFRSLDNLDAFFAGADPRDRLS